MSYTVIKDTLYFGVFYSFLNDSIGVITYIRKDRKEADSEYSMDRRPINTMTFRLNS